MPRARIVIPRTPYKLLTREIRPRDGDGPRLWNAKRRIKTSKGAASLKHLQSLEVPRALWDPKLYHRCLSAEEPTAEEGAVETPAGEESVVEEHTAVDESHENEPQPEQEWWKLDRERLDRYMDQHPLLRGVSSDVRSFISSVSHTFDRTKIYALLKDPARFFSKPQNVPLELRQQVYFPSPRDAVVLMRTPHLGARYAVFDVPLHFSKLHMRAYLKDIYDVDVLHVRSVVVQHKMEREDGTATSQGRRYRPNSTKKMTCQLAKPFVYPEEVEDLAPWEHDEYWKSMKEMVSSQREETSQWGTVNPNHAHRESIALQAQQLLQGKTKWGPTWTSFEKNIQAMGPSAMLSHPPKPQSRRQLKQPPRSRTLRSPSSPS